MNLNKKLLLYIIFSLIGFGIFIGTLFKNFNDSLLIYIKFSEIRTTKITQKK